jgi:hypothetical protein
MKGEFISMRKGLTVTLLTVAIAILGFNAMAVAPLIGNIKDIVVADDVPATPGNHFVAPNIIDMSSASIVTDDATTPTSLVWSYVESTNTYSINNVATLGAGNPVSPPAANIFAGPGATTSGDPDDSDSNLFTITVRNKHLSPISGDGGEPGPDGILASETKTLTFFVSDGDLASSKTIMVYTDNNLGTGTLRLDRLSPGGAAPIVTWNFTTGPNGWVFANGSGTTGAQSSSGVCLTVPGPGDNIGRWDSPYGMVPLVDNSVYEIRMHLTTTQTTQGAIPLWDLIIQNAQINAAAGPSGSVGANSYGGDYWYLDNIGGSQGVGLSSGRSDFVVYYTPPAVTFPSWRSTSTGAFQPTADPFNDMAFNFRVFDIGSSGYGATNDSGTICLTSFTAGRFSLDNMTRGTALYSKTSLASTDFYKTQTAGGANQTNLGFSGGIMTISPATPGTSWDNNIDTIIPGTLANAGQLPSAAASNWPIAWQSDQILLLEVEVSAATTADQQNQADIIVPMIDAGGSETFQFGFTLPNIKFLGAGTAGAAAPPVGSTAKYMTFAYTNAHSTASDFNFLRPRLDIQNFVGISSANPTGGLRVHSVTVTPVTLQ